MKDVLLSARRNIVKKTTPNFVTTYPQIELREWLFGMMSASVAKPIYIGNPTRMKFKRAGDASKERGPRIQKERLLTMVRWFCVRCLGGGLSSTHNSPCVFSAIRSFKDASIVQNRLSLYCSSVNKAAGWIFVSSRHSPTSPLYAFLAFSML
jgi:hypothetical protein